MWGTSVMWLRMNEIPALCTIICSTNPEYIRQSPDHCSEVFTTSSLDGSDSLIQMLAAVVNLGLKRQYGWVRDYKPSEEFRKSHSCNTCRTCQESSWKKSVSFPSRLLYIKAT